MGKFEFVYQLNGTNVPPAVHSFPVAGSQTLLAGDLVVLSSGQVAKASASVAAPFGVMAEDSSGASAGTAVRVYPISPGQVWRATASASASSAVLGSTKYDITAAQLVDIADSTNGSIFIVKTGSSNTEVYVTFTKTAWTEIGS